MQATSESNLNFAIIGLGLIGGSIAKDVRTIYPDAHISAIDSNAASIIDAKNEGIIDDGIDYERLSQIANFIIIATPIDETEETANRVKDSIIGGNRNFEKYVVIDTASVKASISDQFSQISSNELQFVPTHPMAGTEYVGWKHARKDLFRAKPWILCPHEQNTDEAVTEVTNFAKKLGAKTRLIDATEHDKQAALVSHAVIMLSNVVFDFIASEYPDALDLAGDGFTSTTRLASGNPELHKSIIMNNSENTLEYLEEFNNYLAKKITEHDQVNSQSLLSYFKQNMLRRNKWLHKRS